jgi:hypothetical protein
MVKHRWARSLVVLGTQLAVAFGASGLVANGESPAYMRVTLRGIKAVDVQVAPIEPEIENLGLRRDQIQTDVELELRRNRIPIARDSSGATGHLYLVMNCLELSVPKGILACSVLLELIQDVRLMRDPSITALAPTWNDGGIATGNVDRLTDLRQTIRDFVDEFSNAYLEQNRQR